MQRVHEQRRSPRIRLNDTLRVAWVDAGGNYFHCQAPCVDAAKGGLRIIVKDRMDPLSYVNVQADRYGLIASARVRHAIQRGLKYHVGLEFNPGSRWEALPKPCPDPAC
jgi:hypothetical protein